MTQSATAIDTLLVEHADLERQLSDPELHADAANAKKVGRRFAQVAPIVTAYRKGNVLAIALGHGKTDWVKNVLAAGQADLRFARSEVHIINPRILPAGSDGEGLPRLVRLQLRRMAVLVSDIA